MKKKLIELTEIEQAQFCVRFPRDKCRNDDCPFVKDGTCWLYSVDDKAHEEVQNREVEVEQ